jgi:hypothetical protein
MIVLPNIFEMNFVEQTIFTNPQDFYLSEWSTRSSADKPECNSQFLSMVANETPFLLPHHTAII